MRRTLSRRALLRGAIALPIAGCRLSREAPQDARVLGLRNAWFMDVLKANPVTSTYIGGDGWSPALREGSGRLRDWSPGALRRELARIDEVRSVLSGIPDRELSPDLAVDRRAMLAQAGYLHHQLGDRRWHERAVDTYVTEIARGVDWLFQQVTASRADRAEDAAGDAHLLVSRIADVPRHLEVAIANLRQGVADGIVPDRRLVQKNGIDEAKDLAGYFRDLPASAGAVGSPAGFAEACARAEAAATKFAAALGGLYRLDETVDRYAIGEPEYAWRLLNCLGDTRTPGELWAWGAEQVARYEELLFSVSGTIAKARGIPAKFGTDDERWAAVRAVVDALSKDWPRDDRELVAWYADACDRAVEWGRANGPFTVPDDYAITCVETPPVLRTTISDAAYYPAPAFKRGASGHFYVTPTGNDPGTLKLYPRAYFPDTSVHEGFPGHDWNYTVMNAHAREISPIRWLTPGGVEDSMSMWGDSMATEGWALYAEELMAEPSSGRPYGFYSAEEYVYELQGQLLRAARVRLDVGIHTGRMGWDEAVDYYCHHVDFYPGARKRASSDAVAKATLEDGERAISRYSKWPTQAITYLLGKSAIGDLRDAAKSALGASFDAARFYESFMKMGAIPTTWFRDGFVARLSGK
jgi:uncharacterized protein (DUF885 family)